jgi:hypothetical protein
LGGFLFEGHLTDEALDGGRPGGERDYLLFGGTAAHGFLLQLEIIS